MNIIFAAICATLCLASGLATDLGPLNSTVIIGRNHPKNPEPTDDDIVASKNLIGLLENLRRLMPVGLDDNVPPMDPYVKETLIPAVFDNPDSPLKGTVELSNLVASGAQGFIINSLEVQMMPERVDFNVTVPQLIADLDYLAIDFQYQGFIFNVSGHVQLVLDNLMVEGSFSVDSPLQVFFFPNYRMIGLNVHNYADVQINADTTNIPSEVIHEIKDVLLLAVGNTAMDQMGDILQHYSVEQVQHFLIGR